MATLIEKWFPVNVISRDAAIEMSFKPRPAYYARCKELGLKCKGKGFYDPKIRSIHPWPARRARSVCRAINLGCILPGDVEEDLFFKALGFSKESIEEVVKRGYPPLISYVRPDVEALEKVVPRVGTYRLIDPMAGGGSIPLESLSLGLTTYALEYNPVAYLILKATLEYPARYGLELYEKVNDEAKKLVEWSKSNLGKYYGENDEGYIIARAVRCPNGHVKPLVDKVRVSRSEVKRVRVSEPCNCPLPKDLDAIWIYQHKYSLMNGDLDAALKSHVYVVKQVKGGFLEFGERDEELLVSAYERFIEIKDQLVLPRSKIPRSNTAFSSLVKMGLSDFSLLLNPRQALSLGMISKYVRDRVSELKEEEGGFGLAVGLYLALGVSRLFDFNSILTSWNYRTKTIRDSLASYFSRRRFSLREVYAEAVVPFRSLPWIYEPSNEAIRETAGGILPVLKELCELLEGRGDRIKVIHGDALKLSEYFNQKFDIIHVDPPYYDVHIYSDMSEFSWSVLREVLYPALSDFFEDSLLKEVWNYHSPEVPRSSEIIVRPGKSKYRFNILLTKFLMKAEQVLADNGLLVLWFSHRSWEAWESVINALLKAGLAVTKVYPVASEHPARLVTKGGTVGFNRVLIIISRKRSVITLLGNNEVEAEVRRVVKESIGNVTASKIVAHEHVPKEEVRVFSRATALTVLTRAENPSPRLKRKILLVADTVLKEEGYL